MPRFLLLRAVALVAATAVLSCGGRTEQDSRAVADKETTRPTFAYSENWRSAMVKTQPPKTGCFTVKFPSTTWTEVPCAAGGPSHPQAIRTGSRLGSQTVGNGNDFQASMP